MMKTVHKPCSVLLTLLLVLSMCGGMLVFSSQAATAPALSVESKTVAAGDTVTVTVSLTNATAVYGGNFTLQYDNTKLEAQSFTYGSIVSGHTKNCNLDYQSAGNLIRFTFSGANALPNDGALVTITFKAKESVSGAATLQFTAYRMYDVNGAAITSTAATNGAVTVSAPTAENPALSVESKTVAAGDTVTVTVSLTNATAVYGGNFTLQYDHTKLEAQSFTYGSIVNGHTKNCNLDYQSAGNLIRFTFSGANALPNDGALVTITFKAKESVSGAATLQFTAYRMYDVNGAAITSAAATNGTVTVFGASVTTGALQLQAPSSAVRGQEIRIPIVVSATTDVATLTFSLQYDKNALQYISFAESGFEMYSVNSNTEGLLIVSCIASAAVPSDTEVIVFVFRVIAEENCNTTLQLAVEEACDDADAAIQMTGDATTLELTNVLLGDVNGDGKVSGIDARWVLQASSGARTFDASQTAAADVNGDGKITAVDARWILQAASGARVL